MPKAKANNVQIFRIELQDTERELLRDFLIAQNIQTVGKTIDDLLSFENLYIGATILELATGEEILWGTPNDATGVIDRFAEWWRVRQTERTNLREETMNDFDSVIAFFSQLLSVGVSRFK